MISILAKRFFWKNLLGVGAIVGFVAVSVLAIGNDAVGRLVQAEMQNRGPNFPNLLLGPGRRPAALPPSRKSPPPGCWNPPPHPADYRPSHPW